MSLLQTFYVAAFGSRRRRAEKLAAGRRRPRRGGRPLRVEAMEDRTLLAGDTLCITEFMAANDRALADGDGNHPDWIEIHNPSSSEVDLDGWHLTDDPNQLRRWPLPAMTLDAGGYLIVFASGQPVDDYVDRAGHPHTNFKLSANGESVLLVDGTATIVHGFVDYPPQTGDISYGLLSDLATAAYFTAPTPGGPSDDPARNVVMTEIMYHPVDASGVENLGAEYIELLNRGTAPVDLGGWQFTDGIAFVFPDVTILPGAYLAVAADTAAFAAMYPDVSHLVGGWVGRLSNSSEVIELTDRRGVIIDAVHYADSGDWADRRPDPVYAGGWVWEAPHDGAGRALELVNVDMANDYAHNWRAGIVGGTPGATNSVAAADIAPVITDVAHAPIIPKSTDAVAVTARLLDEEQHGVAATLFWRVSTLTPGLFTQVPMLDDGAHGDGAAGDDVFGARIPPQAHGAIVEFYVRAVDGGGLDRTSPGPTDDAGTQAANLLYQVDNDDRPIDVPYYRSIMTAPEWQTFRTMSRSSDAQMNATLIGTVGGITDIRYNVGIRYRGSNTRTHIPPNNRINIPADRPWLGRTQININAHLPWNQVAGATLFAMADLPAASAWPVRMMHNGADLTGGGYYTHLEVYNSDWASWHFPRDSAGNIYVGRRAHAGPAGGLGAGLEYFGPDPAAYVSYLKKSNASQRDWSDVIRLTDVLNNAPDETYVDELSQIVDIDQWLRTMALLELSGYGEGSLFTGDQEGDDYAMYRGVEDPRFQMAPYDMGKMFDATARGLFTAGGVSALRRLLNHPEILPRYFAQVLDLMDNVLTKAQIRPALEQMLGEVEPASTIDRMMDFLRARSDHVRTLIPLELTAASALPMLAGFPHTTAATSGILRGQAHAVRTRSVRVGGLAATWDAREASWSISDVPLQPGINRLLVQSLDAQGQEVDSTYVEIWRDTGTTHDVSGTIAANTTWTAAAGPYRVLDEVTVAAGVTLTIEPGTSVYFETGAQLTIRGRLLAEGNAQQWLRFTRVPAMEGSWDGVQFVEANGENRLAYAVVEYGVSDHGMIGLVASRAELDHLLLDHTDRHRIATTNASLTVRNSTFTNLFGPGEPPSTANAGGQIRGSGIAAGGQMIIENNCFGATGGHNDVIRFSGPARPGPILQILGNTFTGSGDDILDLVGDAHIEGNLFQHVHRDPFNLTAGKASALSAGSDSNDGVITVVRNVFWDVDHAVDLKRGMFMVFENNTVVGIPDDDEENEFSAINFATPEDALPAKRAYLSGNIFADIPRRIFGHVDQAAGGNDSFVTELEMHNTLIPKRQGREPGPSTASWPACGSLKCWRETPRPSSTTVRTQT